MVYSADLAKGLHFVALDNVTDSDFGAEQLAWLEQDLKKARSDPNTKHIVVGMHKPLADNCTGGHSMAEGGSAGRQDSQKALAMFQQYGVSMVLASHVHQFAQFKQGGIQTYITGGLGAHLRGCDCGDCQAFHHLLQLDVSESDIRVSVIRFPGSQVWSRLKAMTMTTTLFRTCDAPSARAVVYGLPARKPPIDRAGEGMALAVPFRGFPNDRHRSSGSCVPGGTHQFLPYSATASVSLDADRAPCQRRCRSHELHPRDACVSKHIDDPGHRTWLRQTSTAFPVGDRSLAAPDRLSE